MYNVAVIKNNQIINVVVVDQLESAKALSIFLPDMDNFILVTEETGPAFIGGNILNNKFVMPSPYPSWTFNESSWTWEAPKNVGEVPSGKYVAWNEDLQEWEFFDIPLIVEESAESE